MANEGHLVCNHTKNHKNISNFTLEEIKNDLSSLEKTYYDNTGYNMSKFFRFPEGKYSLNALKSLNELGYKTVFWSFAYDDWDNCRQPDVEKAKEKILSNTHNGAILLLHSTSLTNATILGELIDSWRDMGYRFGTLEDIYK
jgi:peptidoglycan-N-acetylmuramic acid deacetylase